MFHCSVIKVFVYVVFATACLDYHIQTRLSTTFFDFFKIFFVVVWFLLFSLTAMLEYHRLVPLSTIIFSFLLFFRKISTIHFGQGIKEPALRS